jgi:hypothetical protein
MLAIGRGQKSDWLEQGVAWVYKGDLHLRIQEEEGVAGAGTEFSEPWVDDLPAAQPAKRVVYRVYYGVTRIMEVHAVLVNGRTIVPFPDSNDRFSMDRWNYSFGKIVELYGGTDLGGRDSLDAVLARAGISVRDNQHTFRAREKATSGVS